MSSIPLTVKLFDDENGVVQLLPLQKRVHVTKKMSQMFCSIPERHQDGHFTVSRSTV